MSDRMRVLGITAVFGVGLIAAAIVLVVMW